MRIAATFQLERADYLQFFTASAATFAPSEKPPPGRRGFVFGLTAFFLTVILLGVSRGNNLVVALGVGMFVGGWLYHACWTIQQRKIDFLPLDDDCDDSMFRETSYTISYDKIAVQSDCYSSTILLSGIHAVWNDETTLILFLGRYQGLIFPKRCLNNTQWSDLTGFADAFRWKQLDSSKSITKPLNSNIPRNNTAPD